MVKKIDIVDGWFVFDVVWVVDVVGVKFVCIDFVIVVCYLL